MKGFRTIGFNIIVTLVVAPLLRWLTSHGVDLGGYTAEQLTMELLVNGNILLRCITSTPVGKTAISELPPSVTQLYDALAAEVARRKAAHPPQQDTASP